MRTDDAPAVAGRNGCHQCYHCIRPIMKTTVNSDFFRAPTIYCGPPAGRPTGPLGRQDLPLGGDVSRVSQEIESGGRMWRAGFLPDPTHAREPERTARRARTPQSPWRRLPHRLSRNEVIDRTHPARFNDRLRSNAMARQPIERRSFDCRRSFSRGCTGCGRACGPKLLLCVATNCSVATQFPVRWAAIPAARRQKLRSRQA